MSELIEEMTMAQDWKAFRRQDGTVMIPLSPEVVRVLETGWSKPVRLRIVDGLNLQLQEVADVDRAETVDAPR
jgi:hypothetical protein